MILAVYQSLVNPNLAVGGYAFANGWLTLQNPTDLPAFTQALAALTPEVQATIRLVRGPGLDFSLDPYTQNDNFVPIPGKNGDDGRDGAPSNNATSLTALATALAPFGSRFNVLDSFGTFTLQSGDFSAQVALDPRAILYKTKVGLDPSQGAWVRDHGTVLDVRIMGVQPGGDCSDAVNYLKRFGFAIYIPAGVWNNLDPIVFDVNGMVVYGDPLTTQINCFNGKPAISLGNVKNIYASDLNLYLADNVPSYGVITSFHTTTRNVVFERLIVDQKGGSNQAAAANAIKLVFDNSPDQADGSHPGLDGFILRDSQMYNVGRMGVEIQNHGPFTDSTAYTPDKIVLRYRNVLIENCLIEDAGCVDGGNAGMGVSFTGPGENVTFDTNTIRRARGPSVEMIGCHRSRVLNNTVDSPLGSVFSGANQTVMQDCEIAGNRTTGTPAPVASTLYSFDGLKFHDNALTCASVLVCRTRNSEYYNNTLTSTIGEGINCEGAVNNRFRDNKINFPAGHLAINLYYNTTTGNMVYNNTMTRPDAADLGNEANFYAHSAPGNLLFNNTFVSSLGQQIEIPPQIYSWPALTPLNVFPPNSGTLEFNGISGTNTIEIQLQVGGGQPYASFDFTYATRLNDAPLMGKLSLGFGSYSVSNAAPCAIQSGPTPAVLSQTYTNGILTVTIQIPGSAGAGVVVGCRVRAADAATLNKFSLGNV